MVSLNERGVAGGVRARLRARRVRAAVRGAVRAGRVRRALRAPPALRAHVSRPVRGALPRHLPDLSPGTIPHRLPRRCLRG